MGSNGGAYINNCFVVFFDIAGFKSRVKNGNYKEIYNEFENIHYLNKEIERTENIENEEGVQLCKGVKYLTTAMFSDSILFISKDGTKQSRYVTIIGARIFFNRLILKGIPITGAIAYGNFCHDKIKSIYFGQPLIDAYLLQEQLRFYGVVLHHTAELQFAKEDGLRRYRRNKHIKKHKISLKTGIASHYTISPYRPPKDQKDFKKKINELNIRVNAFYQTISEEKRFFVDNSIEFINYYSKERII